jgi:hypothetical protein
MVKVYRIEHAETGQGPFSCGIRHKYDEAHRCRDRDHSAANPPGPLSYGEHGTALADLYDKRGSEAVSYVFGFESLKQLKGWFRSKLGRRALAQEGMVLATFEVPENAIARGNWQVAFKRSQAYRLANMDLVELR